MDPQKIHDELAQATNMTADELRDLKETENWEIYGERKSGGEDLNEPVDDMIQLLETPASDYKDEDDGFNEVKEANQALDFLNRMKGVDDGDPMPDSDPPMSKRDMSLLAWGYDPDADDRWP